MEMGDRSGWLVGLCRSGSFPSHFPGHLCPCRSRDWVLRTQVSLFCKEPFEPRKARLLKRGRVEMPILMEKWDRIFCISTKFSDYPSAAAPQLEQQGLFILLASWKRRIAQKTYLGLPAHSPSSSPLPI